MKKSKYKVAKYMRLSRDDGDDRESESIENQRDIIDNYIKEHEDLDKNELFPADWYSISNYQVKTEIIAQAIKNKILISETELYKSRVEGVRNE